MTTRKRIVKRPAKQLPDGTIQLQLTKGYIAVVDTEDADLAQFNWFATVVHHTIYAIRDIKTKHERRVIALHRIILARILGRELYPKEMVDHINGDGLDNHRSNLRLATNAENQHNARISSYNTSGLKGVSWHKTKKKWKTQLMFNGTSIHIGYFDTPELAHAAYCERAKELFGEFARFE